MPKADWPQMIIQ